MAIVESRLKTGTLTFGDTTESVSFACQATNVRVTPTYADDGDALETLCGDTISAAKKGTWQLQGTSVQDFDDPEGFLSYCFEHEMETVPFEWTANATSPTWAGTCTIVALEEGGDVNTRLTTDWAFDIAGKPTREYAPVVPFADTAADRRDPAAADPELQDVAS